MIEIDNLIKDALKNKKSVELKVYRNLKSDILTFKTQKNAPEFTEIIFFDLCKRYTKKMEDAEKQYSQAGREDLATECREELEVLKKLLPKPVEVQDIRSALGKWCVKNNFVNTENESKIEIPKKSMGVAIKAMKEVFPTADGKIISEVVKQYVV